ncbi:MAG: hypothetical protein HY774_26595 [Acidobacteria bacterium]|nr:hypothetical protein [Acidobacteriota bacterium]
MRKGRFSPGWAPESSRWEACFEAHPPEYGRSMHGSRPDGHWTKVSSGSVNTAIPDRTNLPAPIRARDGAGQ